VKYKMCKNPSVFGEDLNKSLELIFGPSRKLNYVLFCF